MINNTLNFTIGAVVGAGIAWGHWGLAPLVLVCGACCGAVILEKGCKILNYFFNSLLTNK